MLARHLSRQGAQCSSALSSVSAASRIVREATAATAGAAGGVEASTSSSAMADSLSLRRALSADASSSSSSSSSSDSSTRTTSFGYETVPEELKASRVASVFSSVASSYDVMNDLMSGGAHRLWKSSLVDVVLPPAAPSSSAFSSSSSLSSSPSPLVAAGFDHLDVAGGTGDVAFRVLQRMRELGAAPSNCSVTVCDINAEMLREGERKARAQGLLLNDDDEEEEKENADGDGDKDSFSSLDRPPSSRRGQNNTPTSKIPLNFVLGDAESLPFADGSFDSYTIAFGIRNVTRIPLALADARRVLKKGGAFACLEFSAVRAPLLKEVYDAYSFEVIPRMGRAVAGDEASYRYLVESIRRFPGRRRFAAMMREAGFKGVRFESFAAGAVALHVGFKL